MSARLRLQQRATAWLRGWPEAIVNDTIGYLQKSEARSAAGPEPYWLELPRWLRKSPRFGRTRRVDSRFLSDVLWGQYCLFLFGRMSDDVFDGEAVAAFMYLGDALLIEAERTFARHFPGGPFGPLFRELVDTSLHGVLEADALQRRPGGTAREYMAAYARMAAILKAGTAAMCVKCGRMRDYPRVSSFIDHVAIAGQIVDDIMDLQQDLARARFNFAANRLMAEGGDAGPDLTSEIGHRIVFEDGLEAVVEEARRHADCAAAAIRPLEVPEADAYVNEFRSNLHSLTGAVHRSRVDYVFGQHLGS